MPKQLSQDEMNKVIAMVQEKGVQETARAFNKSERTVIRWVHTYNDTVPEDHRISLRRGKKPKKPVVTVMTTGKSEQPIEKGPTEKVIPNTSRVKDKPKDRMTETQIALSKISMEQILAENTILRSENALLKEQLEKMRKALQLFI